MIWAASFSVQSRSQMSSATPMTTMIALAMTSPMIAFGSAKTMLKAGSRDAMPIAATIPRNIAMPPSRGVGRVWMSRSRIFG